MRHFTTVILNYLNIKGRASRSQYWYFVLFHIIFTFAAIGIDFSQGLFILYRDTFGPFYLTYSLWTLIPSLTASVRRLHDVGKSGWFLLISLIPLIGAIWLLIVLCKSSEVSENKYGVPTED